MRDIISQQQRFAINTMLKNPINWMTDEERGSYSASGLSAEQWILSFYKVPVEIFIHWKKTDSKRKESPPKPRPNFSPQIGKDCHGKNKATKTKRELQLLTKHTAITHSKRKITITKLSRQFIGDEEDQHRCKLCDDCKVRECLDFAIKMNIDVFSCINCQFFKQPL